MVTRQAPAQEWSPEFLQAYWRLEEDWWWFTGRRHLVAAVCGKSQGVGGRVLELGCGSGINAGIFCNGTKYVGVDVSLPSLRHGAAQNSRRLCVATLGNLPFASSSFDRVLLLDVLEHLDDEGSALDETYRVLREGGEVLVISPAHMCLWGAHDVANGHKRRYSATQLRRLLSSHGLEVEKLDYWNCLGFPALALVRWRDRMRGLVNKPRGDFREVPRWLNRLLHRLLQMEGSLVCQGYRLPMGTSLLAVARKGEQHPSGNGRS